MADNEELDPNEAIEPLEGEEGTEAHHRVLHTHAGNKQFGIGEACRAVCARLGTARILQADDAL